MEATLTIGQWRVVYERLTGVELITMDELRRAVNAGELPRDGVRVRVVDIDVYRREGWDEDTVLTLDEFITNMTSLAPSNLDHI